MRESQLTVRLRINEALPRGDATKKKVLHAYSLLNPPANFAFSLQIPGFASGKPPNAKVDRDEEEFGDEEEQAVAAVCREDQTNLQKK